MKAADIMVTKVITVGPGAGVAEVANILLTNRISAVPVVNQDGKILGIVSEGDLLRRSETDTLRRRSWWLEMFMGSQVTAAEYVQSHSRKVVDIMTRRVISATPDTPLHEIATLLERNRIKRAPIVQDGKIVGIVSRANLVQALATVIGKTNAASSHKRLRDSDIRTKVIKQLSAEPWCPSMLNVTVHEGVVELWGIASSEDQRKATRLAAEITPGVKSVNNNLLIPPPSAD